MRLVRWAAGLLAAAGFVSQAHAVNLRVLSSWDNTYPLLPALVAPYLKAVETASKGEITFTVSGPETVPPFEQLQPVGAGAFDMLFSNSAYHLGNTPFLAGTDAIKGDSKKWRETGLYDLIDNHYKRFGVRIMFLAKSPPDRGYQLILRNPVTANGDLAGRKIRGTQLYTGAIALMGGSPVVLPPAEIYTSLEKGVVDGAGWPVIGVEDYRWYEVAKYLLRPTFGPSTHFMFINVNTWNRLTPAQQAIMTDQAKNFENAWPAEWDKIAYKEEKQLIEKGMQVTEAGPSQKDKLSAAYDQGLWELVRSKDPRSLEELQAFAKKNNM